MIKTIIVAIILFVIPGSATILGPFPVEGHYGWHHSKTEVENVSIDSWHIQQNGMYYEEILIR